MVFVTMPRCTPGSGEPTNTSQAQKIGTGNQLTKNQVIDMETGKPNSLQAPSPRPLKEGKELDKCLAKILAVLQAASPSQPLSDDATEIYLSELGEIYREVGQETLEKACTACLRECRFMPTIAEVRERAGLNQEKKDAAEATQAWEVVMQYLRRHGTNGLPTCRGRDKETGSLIMEYPPELPERIAAAVRIAGGLRAIEETASEDLHYRRKDFTDAYEAQDYIKRFPLQLPESLRYLLPGASRLKALPSRNEVAQTLDLVEDATRDEMLARAQAKVESARVIEDQPSPRPIHCLRGPWSDEYLATARARAFELEKRFKQAEVQA